MHIKLKSCEEGLATLDAARKQLGILSFEETIFFNQAKVMYTIAYNYAPIYLTDLFQIRGNESDLNHSHLNFTISVE